MIFPNGIYKQRHTGDYVVTDYPNCQFVTVRPLTRDINVQGGFVLEQHHMPMRFPMKRFERDWEFIREM
jgi:hypothetical protein